MAQASEVRHSQRGGHEIGTGSSAAVTDYSGGWSETGPCNRVIYDPYNAILYCSAYIYRPAIYVIIKYITCILYINIKIYYLINTAY